MSEPGKQNYLHGAAILAFAVVIMKILGAIYKIPLGNILGDEGYTHFLVAYNIYSVFLTLATAGLPVALSRLIAEANTMDRPNQVRRIFSVAWWTFFVIGVVCTLIMALFPNRARGLAERPRGEAEHTGSEPRGAARLPHQRLPRLLPGPREHDPHHGRPGARGAREGRRRARARVVSRPRGAQPAHGLGGRHLRRHGRLAGRAGLYVLLQAPPLRLRPGGLGHSRAPLRRAQDAPARRDTDYPRLERALAHKPHRLRPLHGPAPGRGGLQLSGGQGALRRLRQGADALQPARELHHPAHHLRRPGDIRPPWPCATGTTRAA